jgi:ABC-type dipeptide/oligopeptide/nickel transport system ATPase component
MEPIEENIQPETVQQEFEPQSAQPDESGLNNEDEPTSRNILQRLKDYFFKREIKRLPEEDRLYNNGNPVTIFIDRYFRRRQCPYCFGFVTSRVYRKRSRPGGEVIVNGVTMSMQKIKTYECPGCAAQLPSDFFASRSVSIALVGGTGSGKSSFITIFCELLLHQHSLLSELGISGSIINKDGEDQFIDNRKRLIRQELALLGTTTIQKPIVVRLHSNHHKKITYITLLDSPGEDFTKVERLAALHPNLQYAKGIVFLMNPLDIAELLRLIRKEKPGHIDPDQDVTVQNYKIVETLHETYLESRRVKPNRKIKTPTAFCLSRADLLEDIANLYLPPDFEPDMTEIEDILEEMKLVREDMRELLEETDLNLLNIMDKRFKNLGLFPVSPLGKAPSSDGIGQRVEGGVDPKGVLQPIIWILHETKFILQR